MFGPSNKLLYLSRSGISEPFLPYSSLRGARSLSTDDQHGIRRERRGQHPADLRHGPRHGSTHYYHVHDDPTVQSQRHSGPHPGRVRHHDDGKEPAASLSRGGRWLRGGRGGCHNKTTTTIKDSPIAILGIHLQRNWHDISDVMWAAENKKNIEKIEVLVFQVPNKRGCEKLVLKNQRRVS